MVADLMEIWKAGKLNELMNCSVVAMSTMLGKPVHGSQFDSLKLISLN